MKIGKYYIHKQIALAILSGIALTLIWVVLVRFVTLRSNTVHYHANFAVYLNGKKQDFASPTFYEEVQACSGEESDNPRGRVHLHQPNNHAVHVHDQNVTWGAFFANLGWALGNNFITDDSSVFVDGAQKNKLTFILNGEKVPTISNSVIHSEDVLLIHYGSESTDTIKKHYDEITKDAGEFNKRYDPATCSGSQELTFFDRIKYAFGL